jgi:hypothetical protein
LTLNGFFFCVKLRPCGLGAVLQEVVLKYGIDMNNMAHVTVAKDTRYVCMNEHGDVRSLVPCS